MVSVEATPSGGVQAAQTHKRVLCKAVVPSVRKQRRLTPANSMSDNDDDDDDEFFGIMKAPAKQLMPLSPPHVAYLSSDADDSDNEQLRRVRKPVARRRSTFGQANDRLSSSGTRRKSFLGGVDALSAPSHHRRRRSVTVPESDLTSRQRCFDYLVSAIDAVWAQYCDCTSYAESEMYSEYPQRHEMPFSPVSLCDEEGAESNSEGGEGTPNGPASQQPLSVRLMNLKKRLLAAKYFFVDLLDSLDMDKSAQFWHRWDLVKYATIELVEEADDDDVIEEVTLDLEEGRYHGTNC